MYDFDKSADQGTKDFVGFNTGLSIPDTPFRKFGQNQSINPEYVQKALSGAYGPEIQI